MSRRAPHDRGAFAIAMSLGAGLALLLLACGGRESGDGGARGGGDGGGAAGDLSGSTAAGSGVPFDLYFPGPGGRLVAERRAVAAPADPAERARSLVAALLAGPSGADRSLQAPLPPDVRAGLAFVSPPPASVLYLDLVAPQRALPPPSGSSDELLTVYSLVDTVLLNVPEIRRVVLLWNGQQRESFAGHVDTARPLAARESLIRTVAAAATTEPAPE